MGEQEVKKYLDGIKDKSAAVRGALAYLGDDALAWWQYRHRDKRTHIVDPETGKWVSEFQANGQTYYIRGPKDGIGLRRYAMLKKMLSVVGFDASFPEQMQLLGEVRQELEKVAQGQARFFTAVEKVLNMQKAIEQTNDRNYDFSLYTASLFVVRKGEDLAAHTDELAEEKIKDWEAAGIHEEDFFFLVLLWGMESRKRLETSRAQLLARLNPGQAG